jgi:hypothetical protein
MAVAFGRPDVDAFLRERTQSEIIELLGYFMMDSLPPLPPKKDRNGKIVGLSPASIVSGLGA